jgi:hypothetical protein
MISPQCEILIGNACPYFIDPEMPHGVAGPERQRKKSEPLGNFFCQARCSHFALAERGAAR